jgi:hypothetical protein
VSFASAAANKAAAVVEDDLVKDGQAVKVSDGEDVTI